MHLFKIPCSVSFYHRLQTVPWTVLNTKQLRAIDIDVTGDVISYEAN